MTTSTISSRITSVLVAIAALVGLTFGLSGCSSQTVDMTEVTAIIDVRTPEEFAEGHLEGAVNINWQDPTFIEQVSVLDKNGTYVIYCRSGNRSAQAVDTMESIGFTNLTDAGGYLNASNATGLPLVQ